MFFLPFWPNWFGFSSPEVVLVLLESFGAFVGVGEQKVVGRMVIIAMMTIRRHRSSKSTFDASNRNTPEKSQDKTSQFNLMNKVNLTTQVIFENLEEQTSL